MDRSDIVISAGHLLPGADAVRTQQVVHRGGQLAELRRGQCQLERRRTPPRPATRRGARPRARRTAEPSGRSPPDPPRAAQRTRPDRTQPRRSAAVRARSPPPRPSTVGCGRHQPRTRRARRTRSARARAGGSCTPTGRHRRPAHSVAVRAEPAMSNRRIATRSGCASARKARMSVTTLRGGSSMFVGTVLKDILHIHPSARSPGAGAASVGQGGVGASPEVGDDGRRRERRR